MYCCPFEDLLNASFWFVLQTQSPSKRHCAAAGPSMLEECDTSEEELVLFTIAEDCTLKQRVGSLHGHDHSLLMVSLILSLSLSLSLGWAWWAAVGVHGSLPSPRSSRLLLPASRCGWTRVASPLFSTHTHHNR